MASQTPVSATPSPSPVASEAPEVPPSAPPNNTTLVATWPVLDNSQSAPEHTIPHSEAVRMTGENLRRHAREDPNAPDALSEAGIKAIVEQGDLIK